LAAPNQAPLMLAKGGAERTDEMAGKLFMYSSSSVSLLVLSALTNAVAAICVHWHTVT
jgi:hypothetical protein